VHGLFVVGGLFGVVRDGGGWLLVFLGAGGVGVEFGGGLVGVMWGGVDAHEVSPPRCFYLFLPLSEFFFFFFFWRSAMGEPLFIGL